MQDAIAIRNRECSELLENILEDLKKDPRVSAAWLPGSLSRGDYDELSDTELSIVVSDKGASDIINTAGCMWLSLPGPY